jgi:putative phosphoesterase
MVVSDIHGSIEALKKALTRFDDEYDYLFLLGDLLYHGPRNRLPDGHDPAAVAATLNTVADRVVAVRGNCDAEVDQLLLAFPCMADYALVVDGEWRLFLTHGHLYADGRLPFALPAGSLVMSGHTHVAGVSTDAGGVIHANPGSVSLPKPGGFYTGPTYGVYHDGIFEIAPLL